MNLLKLLSGPLESLLHPAKEYLTEKLELEVLKISAKMRNLFESLFSFFAFLLLGFFFLIFAGAGVAVMLNNSLHSAYLGYFIVSFGFLLLFIPMIYLLRKKLRSSIAAILTKKEDPE